MSVDVSACLAAMTELDGRMDDASRQCCSDAAHIVQAAVMKTAPVGTPGNSTNFPGDLKRSIDVQGPRGSNGRYLAEVGPTVVYGRQRELGGDIYPVAAGALHFFVFGQEVFTQHVHQIGDHYTLRGREAADPAIEAKVYEDVSVALEET